MADHTRLFASMAHFAGFLEQPFRFGVPCCKGVEQPRFHPCPESGFPFLPGRGGEAQVFLIPLQGFLPGVPLVRPPPGKEGVFPGLGHLETPAVVVGRKGKAVLLPGEVSPLPVNPQPGLKGHSGSPGHLVVEETPEWIRNEAVAGYSIGRDGFGKQTAGNKVFK